MAFELSFAGIPFNIPGEKLQARIDDSLRTNEIAPYKPPIGTFPDPNLFRADLASIWKGDARVWDLFYPTGGARWAEFTGVMHKSGVQSLLSVGFTSSGSVANPLIIKTSDSDGIVTPMYALPPRSLIGVNGATDLYLVTLVDERFFWPFKVFDGWTAQDTFPDWRTFIDALATCLGIGVTGDPIDANYFGPEIDSILFTHKENPAILLDQAVKNCGRVLTRKMDGTGYQMVKYSQASVAALAAHTALAPYKEAGGILIQDATVAQTSRAPVVPQAVNVLLPRFTYANGLDYPFSGLYNERPRESGGTYGAVLTNRYLTTDLGGTYATLEFQAGSEATVRTTYRAIFDKPGGTQVNKVQTDALTVLLAKDYYDAITGVVNETYTGIRQFDTTAGHNAIYAYGGKPRTIVWSNGPLDVPNELQHGNYAAATHAPETEYHLRIQRWNYSSDPGGLLAYGYPAKVQKWDTTTRAWVDVDPANPVINRTRVKCPNGNVFVPGEVVTAKLVDKVYFSGNSVCDLYSRTGLESLFVNSPVPQGYSENIGYGGWGTRAILANTPLYFQDYADLCVQVSDGMHSGVMGEVPVQMAPGGAEFTGPEVGPLSFYHQMARGGYTGFRNMVSSATILCPTLPYTNANGQRFPIGGCATLTGGPGYFQLGWLNGEFSPSTGTFSPGNGAVATASTGVLTIAGMNNPYCYMGGNGANADVFTLFQCHAQDHIFGAPGHFNTKFIVAKSVFAFGSYTGTQQDSMIYAAADGFSIKLPVGVQPVGIFCGQYLTPGSLGWEIDVTAPLIVLNGNVKINGSLLGGIPGGLGVGSGGTGQTSWPTGGVLVGNGSNAFVSASNTRLDPSGLSHDIEFKLGLNHWVAFSYGSH